MASYDQDSKKKTLGESIGFPGAKSGEQVKQDQENQKLAAMKRRLSQG
jgi:hypothetical protein